MGEGGGMGGGGGGGWMCCHFALKLAVLELLGCDADHDEAEGNAVGRRLRRLDEG